MKGWINEMIHNKVVRQYRGSNEWVATSFGVPKKNKGIRIVRDFRKLNNVIKGSP